MLEVFKKAFLAGLGAVSLSRERLKQLVDELVKAGELREHEGKDLIDEMMKKAADVKKNVETSISKQLDAAYKRLNLVSLEQLRKMERRIQELEKELGGASRPARTTKKTVKKSTRR